MNARNAVWNLPWDLGHSVDSGQKLLSGSSQIPCKVHVVAIYGIFTAPYAWTETLILSPG